MTRVHRGTKLPGREGSRGWRKSSRRRSPQWAWRLECDWTTVLLHTTTGWGQYTPTLLLHVNNTTVTQPHKVMDLFVNNNKCTCKQQLRGQSTKSTNIITPWNPCWKLIGWRILRIVPFHVSMFQCNPFNQSCSSKPSSAPPWPICHVVAKLFTNFRIILWRRSSYPWTSLQKKVLIFMQIRLEPGGLS